MGRRTTLKDDTPSISQEIRAEDRGTIRDVIQAIVSGQVTGDVHIGDKIYRRPALDELSDYLARAVAAYKARMYQYLASRLSPPDQPYKFLYAFEIEDADIFFGRDAASEALHQTVLKDRLTVLHARSGAGKTSLLKAGLSLCLIREGRLPVYARAYEDPVLAVKRAIAPPSQGPWPELLKELTLHEFLGLACGCLSRQTEELVLILDQFEEFFIFWPEKAHRQPFIDALGDCCDDPALPVRFVIGIRGDYFTHLATFERRLPKIFSNHYYLESMTRDEARAAITGPVARLPHPVAYERALLEGLLDDLSRGEVELPHLQIVCTRLYEVLGEGETEITLGYYEKLGRAEGMLTGYLQEVLDRMPGREGMVAREVLKELVSSEATRRVLSHDRLVVRVEAERDELEAVLARLVDARLLHRDQIAGEATYEIAHEYLIQEIQTWIDQADLAFKQAEELLIREVANWRAHRMLIPGDRLEKLYPHRERFKLDDETLDLLLRSVLEAGFAVVDWAAIAGDRGQKVLQAALKDQRQEIRLAALRGLGAIWGMPEVFKLGNESQDVRKDAAEALGKIGDARAVEPLIAALRDTDSEVCRSAAGALEQIGDARAVEPLIAALGDEDASVRGAAAGALGEIGPEAGVVPALIQALGDEDKNVRWHAAWALKIGPEAREAVPALIQALEDEYEPLRGAAAGALRTITGQDFGEDADLWQQWWEEQQ